MPGFIDRLVRCVRTLVMAGTLALGASNAAIAGEDNAEFELTVVITWSSATAPLEFPGDGHMSGLIGATHDARYHLFKDGDTASSGLELVAENGRVATLRAEFAEARRRGRLGEEIDGPDLEKLPGRINVKFKASNKHPLLSFVTMIAPSPDWFTGAAAVPLQVDGDWIKETRITLWAWDSGTDHGTTYNADDIDAQPQQSIRLLASPHFLTGDGLVSMGVATIRRVGP